MKKRPVQWALIALGCGVLGISILADSRGGPPAGSEAPNFSAPYLRAAADGTTEFVLREARGQTVVLDFWATWCPPCKRTLPVLQRVQDHFAGESDVRIFAVNVDSGANRMKLVRTFVENTKLQVPVLIDRGSASAIWQIQRIPLLVIVGPDGVVRHVKVGVRESDATMQSRLIEEIEAARAGKPAS